MAKELKNAGGRSGTNNLNKNAIEALGKMLRASGLGDVEVHVAEVVHHGEKVILPDGMDIPSAISLLERRQEYLEEDVALMETYDVFPFDGALALDFVLTAKYGWSPASATPGMFGPRPPSLINVRTGPGATDMKRVSWGRFMLPQIEGHLDLSADLQDGRYRFRMTASVKRKDEGTIQDIFEKVRARLLTDSIYKGKAIKIKFRDDDGDPIAMPAPEFIDTSKINPAQLIFSRHVEDAVFTNLFTPILRVNDCIANGIPVKRGVLLGGTYGTGKTLAASVAARHAVDCGITYVYIPNAAELGEAIEFAKQYQSPACVIFCEDVDRVLSGERDSDMDELLNLIDGIDTKSANVIVVLTTNALDKVEPAMLRPGRLDAVIDVTAPDAEAAERLLRFYAGKTIPDDINLSASAEALAGQIPAIISEVVNRAKLSQLRLQEPGTKLKFLSEAALLEASVTMQAQTKLLSDRTKTQKVEGLDIGDMIGEVVREQLGSIHEDLEKLSRTVNSVKSLVG